MSREETNKVCFQFVCPRYPRCARARGKGCCVEYPEKETEMAQKGECSAEDGFPLFVGEEEHGWHKKRTATGLE